MQRLRQDLRQRRLAGPDRAFDGDKARLFEELGHSQERSAKEIRRYHGRAAKKTAYTGIRMLAALVTVGATGILAAGACTYAAIAPESQLFGRTVIAGRDPAEFALTYDDGPNDPWTSPLLDLLARHNLRATFFLIGRMCGSVRTWYGRFGTPGI